ncbi:MAG: lipocalin family protein [Luteolibacter sp.]
MKSTAAFPPLKTVDRVDVGRYLGKWYEVARFPKWFQRGCVSATARYSNLPDGSIRVVNNCIHYDGTQRAITGTAKPVDASANRLRVRFSKSWIGRLIPVSKEGNYWIIDISPDYRDAIVGTPDRNFLWFLSRSPSLSLAAFNRMKSIAQAQGFDTKRLVIDQHTSLTSGETNP